MCTAKAKNFRVVEVLVGNVNQRDFYLPQDEVLRNAKRIVAVESYRVGKSSNAPISGAANVSDTVFNKSFLTLETKDGGTQPITAVPLTDLCKQDNAGVLFEVDLPPLNVSKCKITVPTNASLVATEAWQIGFYYEA